MELDCNSIREFQKAAWDIAEQKGFHEGHDGGRNDVLLLLCLVHTEVSEAAQGVKRHWGADGPTGYQKHEFSEELADAVIRIFDLAGIVGIDLQDAIYKKMVANMARPFKYGTPDVEVQQ